ncbi:MAG: hypothetical protein Q7S46_04790 [Gallionella sp.]|nr:hypothetical protein [Gallionella sp.]
MDNVIQFPGKELRQWAGVADAIKPLLKQLGANDQEISELLEGLQPRWEQLGRPFQMTQPYSIPGTLTQPQIDAVNVALQSQADAIAQHFKAEYSQTLIEFAKLELQLLRLGGELA